MQSLIRYEELEATLFRRPLKLRSEALHGEIEAFIDPDLKLNETDKLSQVVLLILTRSNVHLLVLLLCRFTYSFRQRTLLAMTSCTIRLDSATLGSTPCGLTSTRVTSTTSRSNKR